MEERRTYLLETGRFDKIAQKFRSLQVKFAIEQDKHLGEYSSFLSQVLETIYTSKELTCIEMTGNRFVNIRLLRTEKETGSS